MKDFMIETERLCLLPLRRRNIELWMEDILLLENELNCNYEVPPLQGKFREIVEKKYLRLIKDEENYMYHGFWLLIRKRDREVIGGADFIELPNEEGEIELRFELGREFEHHGLMSEAITAICNWAFQQKEILSVIAKIDFENYKAERLLRRCGFRVYSQKDNVCWRIEKEFKMV